MNGAVWWSVVFGMVFSLSCTPTEVPVAERDVDAVVLVTIDALRLELPSGDGSESGSEQALPGLARLSQSSTSYRDALAVVPTSRPSLAAMHTGLGADRTGVHDDVRTAVRGDVPLLADRLRAAGWETAAFVTTPIASFGSGLQRGFDLFDGPEETIAGPGAWFPKVRPGSEAVDHWLTWTAARTSSRPSFVWIHLADLQGVATATTEIAQARREYATTLAQIDEQIGRILTALDGAGAPERTALIVAGTHGVLLGEDDALGAGYWLREETLRVPFYARLPGLASGPSEAPVWLPDVAVTVADLAALGPVDMKDGRSLLDPWNDDATRQRIAWTWAPYDDFGLPPRTVLVEGGLWTRLDEGAETGVELFGARLARVDETSLPKGLRADLRTAGWAEPEGAIEAAASLDGSGYDTLATRLQQVRVHFGLRQGRRAASRGSLLHEQFPGLPATMTIVSVVALLRGDSEEARRTTDAFIATYPDRAEGYHLRGHVALAARELALADTLFRAALALGRVEPELHYDRACALGLSGDLDAAFAELRAAIEGGYRDWTWFDRDPDTLPLRGDARYAQTVREYLR